MGGIFYAFSSFVMSALDHIPAAEGIRAMQRINVDVYHWTFMAAFFGAPILCIATSVLVARGSPGQAAAYAIAACVVYVLGNFVVTAAGNVPLNNALAAADAETVEAARVWSHYLVSWTRWNHVRTGASMIAAGLFLVALRNL
jgi:uncharacterized membrane protein